MTRSLLTIAWIFLSLETTTAFSSVHQPKPEESWFSHTFDDKPDPIVKKSAPRSAPATRNTSPKMAAAPKEKEKTAASQQRAAHQVC